MKCIAFVVSGPKTLNEKLRQVTPQLLEVDGAQVEFELRPLLVDPAGGFDDDLDDEAPARTPLGSQLVIETFREADVVAVAFQHEPPAAREWTELDRTLGVMGTTLGILGGGGNCMRSAHEGFAVWYKGVTPSQP